VEPLRLGAFIWDVDDGAVVVFDRGAAGCGERVHDGVQLRTDGVAEPALQPPHAVAALVEFEIAPVLLQLVIDRFGAVGVGGIYDGVGELVQLCRGAGWVLVR
jgi:hypothetical protein